MNFSVLMAVYAGDVPSYLAEALQSLHTQTLLPDELSLICDGPLTPELDHTIEYYSSISPFPYNVHRMPKNRGLPTALNEGIRINKHSVLARMDADDYSYPERFATQVAYMEQHNLDFIYCDSEEFTESPSQPERTKSAPAPEALGRTLGFRNPLAHPTVMCRKSVYQKLNGYRDIPYFEDYDLYLRIVAFNFRIGKTPEALVAVRVSHWANSRRVGLEYVKHGLHAKSIWMREGIINPFTCLMSLIPFTVFALGPNRLRELLYQRLRKPLEKSVPETDIPHDK